MGQWQLSTHPQHSSPWSSSRLNVTPGQSSPADRSTHRVTSRDKSRSTIKIEGHFIVIANTKIKRLLIHKKIKDCTGKAFPRSRQQCSGITAVPQTWVCFVRVVLKLGSPKISDDGKRPKCQLKREMESRCSDRSGK